MKTILLIITCALAITLQSGCTARTGVSSGHHGVTAKGSTEGGVSGSVHTY